MVVGLVVFCATKVDTFVNYPNNYLFFFENHLTLFPKCLPLYCEYQKILRNKKTFYTHDKWAEGEQKFVL